MLAEFRALAETAGYVVVGEFNLHGRGSARYGISSGRVEEIHTSISVNSAEVVLISPGVNSSQMFRLMDLWKVEVRNRAQVILEIFDLHAKTPRAKLQIEEARLRYEMPFLRHQLRKKLQKEHTGARPIGEQIGAGEDILSLKIKELRRRIAVIHAKISKTSESETLLRKGRVDADYLEVALAGYTNAGKSTLHDALTGSNVEISDSLFTTLSTKVAQLEIPGKRVVIADSVGFISDLPKSLLEAFTTTLVEIGDADLIVLVVDGSDPVEEMKRKVNACFETFERVRINTPKIMIALNKIDLIDNEQVAARVTLLHDYCTNVVPISAKSRTNVDTLMNEIRKSLPLWETYIVHLPYGRESMALLSWIHEVALVEEELYEEGSIAVRAQLSPSVTQKLFKTLPEGSIKRNE